MSKKKQPGPLVRPFDLMALAYLYPLRWLSHVVPLPVLTWIVDRIYPLYRILRPVYVRSLASHMSAVPSAAGQPRDRKDIARQWVRRDLRKSLDDLVMPRVDIDRLSAASRIQGLEHLENAAADGRGVILVSGHFHANRMAKFLLRRIGFPVLSVRNPAPLSIHMGRLGQRLVPRAYGRFLAGVVEDNIPSNSGDRGMLLLRRLRDEGIINVLIDVQKGRGTIDSHLLAWEWRFIAGFIHLSEMTGAPLVPMFCRGNSSRLEICFHEPVRFSALSSGEEVVERFEPFRLLLEEWITRFPEEWEMWTRAAGWQRSVHQEPD